MAAVNVTVFVKNNNVDFALKQLKKKMKDDRVMQLYEEHLAYEKPSTRKKRLKSKAIRKHQYDLKMKNNLL